MLRYNGLIRLFLVNRRVELFLIRKLNRWDLRDSFLYSHACVYDITSRTYGNLGQTLHDRLHMELTGECINEIFEPVYKKEMV